MPKINQGWQKTKDGYIYYEADGSVLKGRQYRELSKINAEKEWYLTEDGKLLTGIQQWAGSYCSSIKMARSTRSGTTCNRNGATGT